MLCCLGPYSWKNQTSDTSDHGISNFPGQRRQYVKTNGNALMRPQQSPESAEATVEPRPDEGQVVSVVVPPGMRPGQTVQIEAPDGSGRKVNATIPDGLRPGQSFLMRIPPRIDTSHAPAHGHAQHTSPFAMCTGASVNHGSPVSVAEPISPSVPSMNPFGAPTPVSSHSRPEAAPSAAYPPFSLALDGPGPSSPLPNTSSTPSSYFPYAQPLPEAIPVNDETNLLPTISPNMLPPNHSLLLVNVPPGTPPGSTIHVRVPGESRTIAAQVPPGVSQFHVAYECQGPMSALPKPIPPPKPVPIPAPSDPNQKLIMVRVPPGTAPGTTLHVEVPDEPGRILAAQVPPNVTQFQVAYRPQRNNNQSNANNNTRPNRHDNNNNSGGDMSDMFLPVAGGAALAVAGAAMFEHFANRDG